MSRAPYFKLETAQRITPGTGEDLGADLRDAGDRAISRARELMGEANVHHRLRAAILYRLAADAYRAGVSASIGHGRRDRYSEAAKAMDTYADKLEGDRPL